MSGQVKSMLIMVKYKWASPIMTGELGELHELDKSVYFDWFRILDLLFIPSILLARFQTSAWSTPRSIRHPTSQDFMDERNRKMLENKRQSDTEFTQLQSSRLASHSSLGKPTHYLQSSSHLTVPTRP